MGRRGTFSAGDEMDCSRGARHHWASAIALVAGARICATRWLAKTKSAHRVQQTGMTGKADEGRFAIVTNAR